MSLGFKSIMATKKSVSCLRSSDDSGPCVLGWACIVRVKFLIFIKVSIFMKMVATGGHRGRGKLPLFSGLFRFFLSKMLVTSEMWYYFFLIRIQFLYNGLINKMPFLDDVISSGKYFFNLLLIVFRASFA